ncbi:MAG: CPBP family intramembrane glutamic endopeptidase [Luteolibacter sp.]
MANRPFPASFRAMRDEAHSDVLKVWLYAAASVVLGAWMTPLIYNMGKALAEVASVKFTNGPVDWLAGVCRTTSFPGFFTGSLIFAAVLLFLPFVECLRGGRAREGSAKRPWRIRLPEGARQRESGQRLLKGYSPLRLVLNGFMVVTGLFLLIGGVLIVAGVFEWRSPEGGFLKMAMRAALWAFGLAALQELLFRGIAMGIFLRAMGPAKALGMSAVFFALVLFLKPGAGLSVADPDGSGTGFEMLHKILAGFFQLRVMLGSFLPLLALGSVLAFARWRTASLWLPIGLNAGWIFVNTIMAAITVSTSAPDSMMWVISGAALRQGLVPVAGILIAGILIDYLTAPDPDAPEASS